MAILERVSERDAWIRKRAREIETNHIKRRSKETGRLVGYDECPQWCFGQAENEYNKEGRSNG